MNDKKIKAKGFFFCIFTYSIYYFILYANISEATTECRARIKAILFCGSFGSAVDERLALTLTVK